MELETIIGLEVHLEIKTKTKLFCSCPNKSESLANENICPVCLGHPGVMPVLNLEALKKALILGLALNGKIAQTSYFERKNYFYPDLPKGYQISQFALPLVKGGFLETSFSGGDNIRKKIHPPKSSEGGAAKPLFNRVSLERIHLEEDAAKLLHGNNKDSFVDFNRSGIPLIELVTKPDLRSAKEAKVFLEMLRLVARYLDISEAEMQKGQMRCDANISLRPKGEKTFFAKTEIKNLNSFKAVEDALSYEEKRQRKLWEEGRPPQTLSTRGFDDKKRITVLQREKEESHDYRYFPEPDLPFLEIETLPFSLEELKESIEELPLAKKNRLMENYGFSTTEAEILIREPVKANFLEEVIVQFEPQNREGLVKTAINWLVNRLPGEIISPKEKFLFQRISEGEEKPINAKIFAEFVKLIFEGKISSTLAQKILEEMKKTGKNPLLIIKESKIEMIADEKQLEEIIKKIIEQNKKVVADFKKGKENALQFLVGLAMRETRGKADPQKVSKILKKFLQAL